MTEDRDVLTIAQVADILQVHYNTAYKRVRAGEIPAFQIGTEWRVLRTDLFKYLETLKKSRDKRS